MVAWQSLPADFIHLTVGNQEVHPEQGTALYGEWWSQGLFSWHRRWITPSHLASNHIMTSSCGWSWLLSHFAWRYFGPPGAKSLHGEHWHFQTHFWLWCQCVCGHRCFTVAAGTSRGAFAGKVPARCPSAPVKEGMWTIPDIQQGSSTSNSSYITFSLLPLLCAKFLQSNFSNNLKIWAIAVAVPSSLLIFLVINYWGLLCEN